MKTLMGREAVEYVEEFGGSLNKFADPTEDALFGVSIDYAYEIIAEDPNLIYICIEE